MKIGEIWIERLEKSKFKTLENFLDYFTNEDYKFTREELLEDIEFYIDELLGYNDIEILALKNSENNITIKSK